MSDYDAWLESGATDVPECCEECMGDGDIDDPDGVYDRIVCPSCGGSGNEEPTREEIAEVRGEREFDALHDEGRI